MAMIHVVDASHDYIWTQIYLKKTIVFCNVVALCTLMSSGCKLHNLKVIIVNFGLRIGSPFHKSHYSRRCLLQLFVNTVCPLAAWRLLFLFLMMPSAPWLCLLQQLLCRCFQFLDLNIYTVATASATVISCKSKLIFPSVCLSVWSTGC